MAEDVDKLKVDFANTKKELKELQSAHLDVCEEAKAIEARLAGAKEVVQEMYEEWKTLNKNDGSMSTKSLETYIRKFKKYLNPKE